ncbi:MAG: hypothetical protein WCS56_00155 [Bacilli bacterium]
MKNYDIMKFLSDEEEKRFVDEYRDDWENTEAPQKAIKDFFESMLDEENDPIIGQPFSPFELLGPEIVSAKARLNDLLYIDQKAERKGLLGIVKKEGYIKSEAPKEAVTVEAIKPADVGKDFASTFKRLKRELAEKRDELRDLIADAGDLLDSNERAMEGMEEAADALSEYL